MADLIKEFRLHSEDNQLFNASDNYVVPLYQRAYSWGEKEIEQLVDDINDFTDDNYYLGSLIVHSSNGVYEVIDGQQRLTTLFILFKVLGIENYSCLSFECRDISNYTLSHLDRRDAEDQKLEMGIVGGFNILKQKIEKEINKDAFIKKLSKTIIYRIEVPDDTDLNRYFEIMNTRGEQLEQHDILKAMLMSNITGSAERNAFATIWDACSDMTGYVQMHFPRYTREKLFGSSWNCLDEKIYDRIISSTRRKRNEKSLTIQDALQTGFIVDTSDGFDEKEERVRFESIIDFPYFLQHVLKVYISDKGIAHINPDEKIVKELLDDKKLYDTFDNVIKFGSLNGKKLDSNDFSIDFSKCLLRCRFLFDEYFIKREYPLNDQEGVWSIKTLHTSGTKTQKKPYYKNTIFHRMNEWEQTYSPRNLQNIMIQSCLRVSYTSPKIMHWITKLLMRLYSSSTEYDLVDFNVTAESIAKEAVKNDFFDVCQKQGEKKYLMGVNTPHIVFNYLDYLIWNNNRELYSDFVFEFRNSVEHWYPRNPSDGTFPKWEDGVDTFGNLCIVQRNINSKFSNMAPEAKKSTYKDMIAKGSLKLRLMASSTNSSLGWKDDCCKRHEEEMIILLIKDIIPQ